jgi:hypothetical protein
MWFHFFPNFTIEKSSPKEYLTCCVIRLPHGYTQRFPYSPWISSWILLRIEIV